MRFPLLLAVAALIAVPISPADILITEFMASNQDVLVLDVGTLPPSAPSTIVDCTGTAPVVLRQGTVPIERLRCAVPEIHGE